MINDDVIMSQKPYLIRAMYEWMLDFGYTPRIVVCPLVNNVVIPDHLSGQNQVTLDISPQAISGLMLGNDSITFEAYFDKSPYEIILPLNCVGAIIAKEKEVGYVFDIDDFIPQKAISDISADTVKRSDNSIQHTSRGSSGKGSTPPRKKENNSKSKFSGLMSLSKKGHSPRKLSKATTESTAKKGNKKKEGLLSSIRKKINV